MILKRFRWHVPTIGTILFLALALARVPVADAGSATLTWVPPTTNVDGSALSVSEITGYRVSWGCGPSGTYDESVTTDGDVTTALIDTLPNWGVCYFAAQTLVGDLESDFSNEAMKDFGPAPPDPPALTVGIDVTAFVVQQSIDRIVLVPVGTVPPDTVCDGSQSVNGRFLVPRDVVTWAGTVRAEAVFATCVP